MPLVVLVVLGGEAGRGEQEGRGEGGGTQARHGTVRSDAGAYRRDAPPASMVAARMVAARMAGQPPPRSPARAATSNRLSRYARPPRSHCQTLSSG